MRPYYEDPWVCLYLGDCREVTEWLDADVLVTDPPYGIAWRPTPLGPSRLNAKDRIANDAHEGGISNDESTEARDTALALWGDRPAYVFGSLMLPPPQGTKQVAVYGKPENSGTLVNIGGIRRDVEAIYLTGRHRVTGGGRSSIFKTHARRVSGGKPTERGSGLVQRYGHSHAKPVDVMQMLIMLSEGTIADPFAGSGSTLVAAKMLSRKAIGVEIEERYCEIAANRLRQDALPFKDGAA